MKKAALLALLLAAAALAGCTHPRDIIDGLAKAAASAAQA